MSGWMLEDNVNDWVKSEFARIKQTGYTVESAMSDYLKNAIQEGAKLKRIGLDKEKSKSWKPDFELEVFNIPVLIAVNGAIHYAQ